MPSRSLLCAASKRLRAKNPAATRSAARFASAVSSRACSASSRGPDGALATVVVFSRSRAGGLGLSALLAGGDTGAGDTGADDVGAGDAGAGDTGASVGVLLISRSVFGVFVALGRLISVLGGRSSLAFFTTSAVGASVLSATAPDGVEDACQ